jgi:hypothetical protein
MDQSQIGQSIPPLPKQFTISLNAQLQNKIQNDYADKLLNEKAKEQEARDQSTSSGVYDRNARHGGNALGNFEDDDEATKYAKRF